MNRKIKLFAVGIVLLMSTFMYSCNNDIDVPVRTPELEKKEIKEAIAALTKAGFSVDSTESGLYYILHKEGTGPTPEKGDTCRLIYNGYFLSGDLFDSSGFYYNDSIWQFRYLEVPLIYGFNEGVAMLNNGAITDFIIPSSLAYMANGHGSIPPYTPLFFNMKMVEIKALVKEE